ncbi:MAG: rod shape-determining protein MreD [Desulfuromonadaceae bacterium]|nr:rod shape-determining protein MreD [Desulfuromonadaceae bacterium]
MRRLLLLTVFIATAVLVQTWLFPRMFPISWKPDLFLVMVVYLAFFASFFQGALACFALGCLMDVFGGNVLGLYGLVYAALFFVIRILVSPINIETTFPFYYMVALGTCLELILIAFLVVFFSPRGGGVWALVTFGLFPQAGLNLVAAFVLLKGLQALRRKAFWAADLPGPSLEESGL